MCLYTFIFHVYIPMSMKNTQVVYDLSILALFLFSLSIFLSFFVVFFFFLVIHSVVANLTFFAKYSVYLFDLNCKQN